MTPDMLNAFLVSSDRVQRLTDDDARDYGAPTLCMLCPPPTTSSAGAEKRANWVAWRAAPYAADRHSEYMLVPTDLCGKGPKLLVSAVMTPPNNLDDYVAALPKERRYTIRGRKALNRGYAVQRIHPADHAAEIRDIVHSSELRQGRSIAPMFANRPADYPFEQYLDVIDPAYRDICLGVFAPDGRMVAYLLGKRVGDHVQYDEIMGHHDHVANDVMYLLHFEFLKACLAEESVPQCLNYGPWYSGQDPFSATGGLNFWKRRIGFRPAYLILACS